MLLAKLVLVHLDMNALAVKLPNIPLMECVWINAPVAQFQQLIPIPAVLVLKKLLIAVLVR